ATLTRPLRRGHGLFREGAANGAEPSGRAAQSCFVAASPGTLATRLERIRMALAGTGPQTPSFPATRLGRHAAGRAAHPTPHRARHRRHGAIRALCRPPEATGGHSVFGLSADSGAPSVPVPGHRSG